MKDATVRGHHLTASIGVYCIFHAADNSEVYCSVKATVSSAPAVFAPNLTAAFIGRLLVFISLAVPVTTHSKRLERDEIFDDPSPPHNMDVTSQREYVEYLTGGVPQVGL